MGLWQFGEEPGGGTRGGWAHMILLYVSKVTTMTSTAVITADAHFGTPIVPSTGPVRRRRLY